MVNLLYIKNIIKRISTVLFLLFLLSTVLLAETNSRTIIISGQVINYEYGNPVEGHEVLIKNVDDNSERYLKILFTDIEGFYYDTITTNKDNGSFVISTNDYQGNTIDTTVHYRFFNYSAFDVIIANFRIYMPFSNPKLQAKFKYTQKQGSDRLKFKFLDLTEQENIILWEWDFGDGKKSYSQNPTHLYSKYGTYKVSFTVTTKTNTKVESNTITRLIYISDRSYYHMGGHAFAEYFPIDQGLAYLYYIDSIQNYVPVDTVEIDTLGFYLFYQIPEGDYVIKVQPSSNSKYYGENLPTYFGNEIFWTEATIIHFLNTCWEYDIHMQCGQELLSGDGFLNGNIIFTNPVMSAEDFTLKNIDVFLFNDEGNILISHYSNTEGVFNFNNIATGTYSLYPEVTGMKNESQVVVLSEDNPIATNLELIVGPAGPNFIFNKNEKHNLISNIFPNPASSVINIGFDTEVNKSLSVEIYDLQGRLVFSEITGIINSYKTIDISQFKNGTYILLLSNSTQSDKKLFTVTN